MLMLNEAWKQAYSDYLKEQEENLGNEIDTTLVELTEAQKEAQAGFSMLREYYEIFALSEGVNLTETPGEAPVGTVTTVDNDGNIKTVKPTGKMIKQVVSAVQNMSDDDDIGSYNALQTVEITGIQDMKFPKNIIFFIGQLIKWIRNIVIYFIEKFKNIIRKLVGADVRELNPNSLKLQLQNIRKIEKISTSIDTKLKGPLEVRKLDLNKLEPITLEEDWAQTLGIVKPNNDKAIKEQPVIITLDLARDVQNLRTVTDHFFKLFNRDSLGSNGEYLFDTEDLETILKQFKDTITRLKTGDIQQYSVSGGVAVDAGISSAKVKHNLEVTNYNITNLKKAFVQTSESIKNMTKIIQNKEMIMLADIGGSAQFISSQTLEQLLPIAITVEKQLKEANNTAKKFEKMKKNYEKLVNELRGMQQSIAGVSNITFDTIYNRKIVDLINASQWMSDTVTLRLSGMVLYIKELNEIKDILNMIIGFNSTSSRNSILRKLLKK